MKSKTKKRLIPKVTSLGELANLAHSKPEYCRLALLAASNLGGDCHGDLEKSLQWLYVNASETDEAGVVDEVNFVRDLV